jgi:2-phosphoglycerate kinase
MIYFIGGPPRCGKTTLAKHMSKQLQIPWISCDTLEVVSGAYMTKIQWDKTHPYSVLRRIHTTNDRFYEALTPRKIVGVLKKQARATFAAIDMMTICEIKDGNDYIIEGYHLEPRFIRSLVKKYGKKHFKAVFLIKTDADKFAQDVHKSTTPNDWLILGTKKKENFVRVGQMVAWYSHLLEKEAKKYGFPVVSMDQEFPKQLRKGIVTLTR